MALKEKVSLKQCPACGSWDVRRGATIEDGSIGDWCPHCKKSLQRMKAESAEDITRKTKAGFQRSGYKQCPTCSSWDVQRGATIEDGGVGHWCPHCEKSIEKMIDDDVKKQLKLVKPEFAERPSEPKKQCPACGSWDVRRGATIEDGSIGDWCPHCKQSIQETQQEHAHVIPFEFTGKAAEYFRIWIVNIFLSLLTLGIYSAWAKVRNKRYFYGNTLLESAPFEYLARPNQILKGRLIAIGAFTVYAIMHTIMPVAGKILGFVFVVFALPWLVIRARSFNLRNSSHRNIRFNFKARYADSFTIFSLSGFLVGLTLGITYPLYVKGIKEFLVEHSRYGTKRFSLQARDKSLYPIYLKAVGLLVLGVPVMMILFSILLGLPQLVAADPSLTQEQARWLVQSILIFPLLIFGGFVLLVRTYIQTSVTNFVWNNAVFGEHRFQSTLRPSSMIWIVISNMLATLFSFGLLAPWAKIRMARYRLENLKLLAAGNLDEFVADEQEEISAAGEEIADFFDFDFWV